MEVDTHYFELQTSVTELQALSKLDCRRTAIQQANQDSGSWTFWNVWRTCGFVADAAVMIFDLTVRSGQKLRTVNPGPAKSVLTFDFSCPSTFGFFGRAIFAAKVLHAMFPIRRDLARKGLPWHAIIGGSVNAGAILDSLVKLTPRLNLSGERAKCRHKNAGKKG
jgi:hypothetical protein